MAEDTAAESPGAESPARISGRPGRDRQGLAAGLIPAAAAFALGMWGITREGTMWRDESVTYQVAHRSLPEIWRLLRHADAVHGLYYFFMHALFGVWDGGLLTLRIPSVLSIAVAAAFVGLIGRRLAGVRAGVFSGTVFALVPDIQMYAQEGRSYAMVCALVACSTYLLVRSLDSSSGMCWTLYALVNLTAVWLHEFAVLALLAHGVSVAVTRPGPRNGRSWSIAAAVAFAGSLPLILFSMGQSDQVSWIGWPKAAEWGEIAGWIFVSLAAAGYLGRGKGRSGGNGPSGNGRSGSGNRGEGRGSGNTAVRRVGLPLAVLPTAVLLLGSLHEPMYVDRYALFTNVGIALLLGTALDRLSVPDRLSAPSRRTGTDGGHGTAVAHRPTAHVAAMAGLFAVLALVLVPVSSQLRKPESRKDDLTAIAKAVEEVSADGDGVIFTPARRREWKLSATGRFDALDDLALEETPAVSGSLQGEEMSAARVRARMLSAPRIVVLSDPPGEPEDAVAREAMKRAVLRTYFHVCARERVLGAQITLYAQSVRACDDGPAPARAPAQTPASAPAPVPTRRNAV
ncbi:glycosyltransferase family 39 protein [Streptomyces sp. NPDC050804]|uniref:glycosyltransferase family 39 protein n=1 Tax=Streptomyces sp. NPDC050804 TaxID=3154745 RepID=UPI00343E9223